MRMHAVMVGGRRVILAHRRGPAPGVPVHPLRRLGLRRADHHRVQAIIERPHVTDLTDRAALNVLHEAAHALVAVAMVADLRRDARLFLRRVHEAHLLDREGHRLLDVDVKALRHREDRGGGVMVVGRRDRDGVDLAPHLIQHFTVIVKRPDLRAVRRRLMMLHHGADHVPMARIRLGHADDLLVRAAHAVQNAVADAESHAAAASDEAQPDFLPGGNLLPDRKQRNRRTARSPLQKITT